MGIVPNALIVNPDKIAAKTVPEFIAYAQANPGKITVATQGNGTTSHLTSELFQLMAKVKLLQVPYRGTAPALQGLLAGDVDVMFDNLGVSLGLVKGGKLRLIAVGTERRMSALPDVPTIAESLPGFASSAWFAVVAPPKTPAAIVAKINADIAEAVRDPDVRKRLADLSAEPVGGTVPDTAAFMRAEVERWNNVIKAANVKLE
jgi:tripartite-type tricarboxylate transporter receptor subunit TctC